MFHKEGFNLIILFFILVATDVIMLEVLFDDSSSLKSILQIFSLIIFVFILWFFRNPKRNIIIIVNKDCGIKLCSKSIETIKRIIAVTIPERNIIEVELYFFLN